MIKDFYFDGIKIDNLDNFEMTPHNEIEVDSVSFIKPPMKINAEISMTLIPSKKMKQNLERMLMINLPRKLKKKLLGTRRKRNKARNKTKIKILNSLTKLNLSNNVSE